MPTTSGVPVAISFAPSYDTCRAALRYGCNLIGGLATLVRGKVVSVKVNVTGWGVPLQGSPATESYVVHGDVVSALVFLLFEAGAERVQILESAPAAMSLSEFVRGVGWDVQAIIGAGRVDFINTRNGNDGRYASVIAPHGRLFESLLLHPAYTECDLLVSLAKMKNHRTAGVTLSLKNMFGILPNSRYGTDAPSENAVGMRNLVHDRRASTEPMLPGERPDLSSAGAEVRVPQAIVDIVSALPVHLAIIDGISTVAGGEGPWHESTGELRIVRPSVLLVGRDAVATDAVATAVMGYTDPMSDSLPPFTFCDNHLRIARDASLGVGDLAQIEVRGLSIDQARTPFAWL